jgi:hypothetical protein
MFWKSTLRVPDFSTPHFIAAALTFGHPPQSLFRVLIDPVIASFTDIYVSLIFVRFVPTICTSAFQSIIDKNVTIILQACGMKIFVMGYKYREK